MIVDSKSIAEEPATLGGVSGKNPFTLPPQSSELTNYKYSIAR